MAPATSPQGQLTQRAEINNVFLIAGGSCDASLAEELRNEIRNSGWDCEIVQAGAAGGNQFRGRLRDMLDSFDQGASVNHARSRGERLIRNLTPEEWLAQ